MQILCQYNCCALCSPPGKTWETISGVANQAEPIGNARGANTKLFKNGNSQAVRIPAELAYSTWDVDLVIERQGDELRIRPAQRRMGDVLGKLAKFSPDFMAQGRGENVEGEREAL